MIAFSPLLALLRPLLPYLIGAALVLAAAGWLWWSGVRHERRAEDAAQAQHQIEVLKREKDGDEAGDAVRRDGAAERLRDKDF